MPDHAPAVILVHGLRTSATMWRRQVAALTAAGIPVLAIDLPGHGARMDERFSVAGGLEAIDAAVAEATGPGGERPYLAGFSLGGYLAIEWAARNPGRVSGILAASCLTQPNRVVLGGWRVLARAIHALPDRGRALNDFAVNTFVSPEGAADVLAGGVALEVMDDALRDLVRLRPLEALAAISEPVVLVTGRLDHVGLQARRFLAATRGGRLVVVPGATHMVSVTHPEAFTFELLAARASADATPVRDKLPDAARDW